MAFSEHRSSSIPEFNYAELTFAGLYNPDLVSKAYRALPGVTMTEFASMSGDSSSIFVSRDDAAWHYVFDIAGGDCMAGMYDTRAALF